MAVNSLLTKAYAVNIYRYGNRTFASIPADYHTPVKQYAAENFSLSDIDQALANGYITEQEYTETLAYVPAA
ncbi:hypothetical protein UF75_1183 [Desulfosporosinus sp. I2]|uniref:hypothetical protein n=1 Tax=Desulfosporosinus sp. I2 TaxID=1617025 RepID=UPI00061FDBFC|nr:hypothetical protein [Desulfosporosinus sp. I2]KJR48385.1 hypothetical protein UF75_1183 [Desulfosporosinus sp. I2]